LRLCRSADDRAHGEKQIENAGTAGGGAEGDCRQYDQLQPNRKPEVSIGPRCDGVRRRSHPGKELAEHDMKAD
jgi:hypothetical protein